MMTNKVVLDTNFIFSFIDKNDSQHQQAKSLYSKIMHSSQIIIPAVVMIEASLMESINPKLSEIAFKLIEQTNVKTTVDEKYIKQFRKFVKETKCNLKPNDYSVLHTAKTNSANLLTFDHKLSKAFNE